jgi:hypothetical protein
MNVKARAHRQARNLMAKFGRPTRWGKMNDADKKLFMHVRTVNISIFSK